MKKLLLFIALFLMVSLPNHSTAQQCRHTQPRCNCAFISRQRVILHQLQDDLLIWQTQLSHDRTIWSPRIRNARIIRDMNNIRSLQYAITEQKQLLRNNGVAVR